MVLSFELRGERMITPCSRCGRSHKKGSYAFFCCYWSKKARAARQKEYLKEYRTSCVHAQEEGRAWCRASTPLHNPEYPVFFLSETYGGTTRWEHKEGI